MAKRDEAPADSHEQARAKAADEQAADEEPAEALADDVDVVPVGEPGEGQVVVEVPAGTEGEAAALLPDPSAEYTVLAPMNRHGEILKPGDHVSFEAGEAQHVADLIATKAVFAGTGEDADEAVQQAARLRGIARSTPPV